MDLFLEEVKGRGTMYEGRRWQGSASLPSHSDACMVASSMGMERCGIWIE